MKKKWVTIGVIAVVVVGGGFWGYKHFTAKPKAATNITAAAKIADVNKVITATGTVNFPQSLPLTFSASGRIVQINVKQGDTVKAGEVLAKIDDSSLQNALVQQQSAVTDAQAKLQTLKDSFDAQSLASAQSTVAKAQQSVASAKQALTTAQQNADSNYLANQVALAQQNLKQASDDYAKAQLSGSASTSGITQAQTALTTALNAQNGGAAQALTAAQAQYTAAQADLASSQASLQDQEAGPKASDLQSDEAGIVNAQAQLDIAEKNLTNAEIISPVDAVVVDMPLQLYQQSDNSGSSSNSSSGTSSIITVTPTGNKLEVDAAIDQADIGQVKVGQKAQITLDTAPNDIISGTVTNVALQGTTTSNVTTYAVKISVDETTDLLRAGMNANVSIIIDQAKSVLTVPSEAIHTRGTESYVLEPLAPGQTASSGASGSGKRAAGGNGNGQSGQSGQSGSAGGNRSSSGAAGTSGASGAGARASATLANVKIVPVVTGLDDGTNIEIKSGLKEGDQVVIGTRSTSTSTNGASGTTNRSGAGAMGGLGAFGGGGGGGNAMRRMGN